MRIDDVTKITEYKTTEFYEDYGRKALYVGLLDGSAGFFEFVKKERIPTHTFVLFHRYVNLHTKKKFGLPLRNGIFVTKDRKMAHFFGSVHNVVPNDGYRMFTNYSVVDFSIHSFYKQGLAKKMMRNIVYLVSGELKDTNIKFSDISLIINNLSQRHDEVNYETLDVSDILEKAIKEVLEDISDEDKQKFIDVMFKIMANYKKDLDKYIDGIEEITDLNTVDGSEIMLFPLNGFWILNE